MDSTTTFPDTRIEAVATACLVALIAGILLPKALFVSLDRAILVWLIAQIACGLIVGTITQPIRKLLLASVLPSAALPIAYCGFLVVRWLIDLAKDSSAGFSIPIFGGSGVGFGPPTLLSMTILAVLALVAFIASYALILVSAFASRPVQRAIVQLYSFGPDGMRRVQRLLVGLVAIVGSLVLLWGAFGA
ncbi:MAG: hypothetical protein IPM73_15930 [Betaproteobacteria bacterium]|nr:hypothetical protein [Betaproteobacteria bacterium]